MLTEAPGNLLALALTEMDQTGQTGQPGQSGWLGGLGHTGELDWMGGPKTWECTSQTGATKLLE